MPAKKTLDMDNRDIKPSSVVRRFMTDDDKTNDVKPLQTDNPQTEGNAAQAGEVTGASAAGPGITAENPVKSPEEAVVMIETDKSAIEKPSKYLFRNAMEDIVYSEVMITVGHIREMCKCPLCVSDICAIVLNQTQPHYVTTETGELIGRAALLNILHLSKISVEVFRAIEMVKKKPSHPLTECVF